MVSQGLAWKGLEGANHGESLAGWVPTRVPWSSQGRMMYYLSHIPLERRSVPTGESFMKDVQNKT